MTTAVTDLSTQKNVSVLRSMVTSALTSPHQNLALGWDASGATQHLLAYCSENFRIISRLFVSFFSVTAAVSFFSIPAATTRSYMIVLRKGAPPGMKMGRVAGTCGMVDA